MGKGFNVSTGSVPSTKEEWEKANPKAYGQQYKPDPKYTKFLKNLMKSPQEGGPTEAATFEYLKSLGTKIDPITKKEVPTTTLQQLIKEHGPKKGEGDYRKKKAHGGYVKKYARGGGVRKAR